MRLPLQGGESGRAPPAVEADVARLPGGDWPRILVVDDEHANTSLLELLLEEWGYTSVTSINDPTRVLDVCLEISPDLILLDLKMPVLSGFDVLELLRPRLWASPPVPVIVLTGDTAPETKRRALAAGARDFLSKPFDFEEIHLRVRSQLDMRMVQLKLKSHGDELEERVRERTAELEHARLEVVDRLAMAAEFRDDDTHQHAQRIGRTSGRIAAELGAANAELIRRAAPLHDIGKIAIPDSILLKPGQLTDAEFETVKTHAAVGAKILSGGESELLQTAEELALTHHERWDGHGYPAGLAGEAIPLSGRIVAVADVFDALTHERPYKPAWSVGRAHQEISDRAGIDFDPEVVEAFLTVEGCSVSSSRSGTPNGPGRRIERPILRPVRR